MAAARGAISSAANASTVERNMSALSPRSKFNPGRRFGRLAIPISLIVAMRRTLPQAAAIAKRARLAPP